MIPDYLKAATAATETLIKYHVTATPVSPLADLGTYMDGYEE